MCTQVTDQASPSTTSPSRTGDVGLEIHVAALLHHHSSGDLAGTMTAVGVRLGIGMRGQQPTSRRMVHVRMGHQHVGDGLAGGRLDDGLDVGIVGRPWVHDRHASTTQNVCAGAVERKRTRVPGNDPADARGHFGDFAVFELERAPERDGDHGMTFRIETAEL